MTQPHILFASPFTCSLAVAISLRQRDLAFDTRWVLRGSSRLVSDPELARVNPKRKVATLVLPSGEVLTENVGILLYLDETHGPTRNAQERRRLIEWLTYLGTELHKQVLALTFDAESSDEHRQDAKTRLLPAVLAYLENALTDRNTLLGGDAPSSADAYLFWGLVLLSHRWPETVQSPALSGFLKRMGAHPYVRAAVAADMAEMGQAAA